MHEPSSSRPSAGESVLFDAASTYEEYLCDHPGAATALMRARQDEVRLAVDDQLFFSMLPQMVHMVVVSDRDQMVVMIIMIVTLLVMMMMEVIMMLLVTVMMIMMLLVMMRILLIVFVGFRW